MDPLSISTQKRCFFVPGGWLAYGCPGHDECVKLSSLVHCHWGSGKVKSAADEGSGDVQVHVGLPQKAPSFVAPRVYRDEDVDEAPRHGWISGPCDCFLSAHYSLHRLRLLYSARVPMTPNNRETYQHAIN